MGTYGEISQCGAGRRIWAAGNGNILPTGGFSPTGNKTSLTFTFSNGTLMSQWVSPANNQPYQSASRQVISVYLPQAVSCGRQCPKSSGTSKQGQPYLRGKKDYIMVMSMNNWTCLQSEMMAHLWKSRSLLFGRLWCRSSATRGGDLLIWGLDKWLFRRVRSCGGRQVGSDEWRGAKKIILETSRLWNLNFIICF